MIVAGFGFSTRASVDSLADALRRATEVYEAHAFATPTDKMALVGALARIHSVPVHPVPAAQLENIETQTQSTRSMQTRRTGSVAEASALAAAGPGAVLLQARVESADRLATCALAQGKNS